MAQTTIQKMLASLRINNLALLGAMFVITFAGIRNISFAFIFGQGHGERPIVPFIYWMLLANILYLVSVFLVLRIEADEARGPTPKNSSKTRNLSVIIMYAILSRLVFFDSAPIQEVDYARYLWDGAVLAHGENPYVFAPQEAGQYLAEHGTPNDTYMEEAGAEGNLSRLGMILEKDERARNVHRMINYPEVRTIYPPLAQLSFALSYWIAPWSLRGLRIVFLLFEVGSILLLVDLLQKMKLSTSRVLIYAWSPLAIKELANSPHLDSIVLFCITLAAWAWVMRKHRLLGLAIGFGILAKTFPVILVPAVAMAVYRRHGTRRTIETIATTTAIIITGYAPFMFTAGLRVFDGLTAFATEWNRNASIYSLFERFVGFFVDQKETWHIADRSISALEFATRGLVGLIILALVMAASLWPVRLIPENRDDTTESNDLLARCLVCLSALFLFAPTGNPWYATWLLPLLCVFPVRGLILLTALLQLYYLSFFIEYHEVFYRSLGWEPASLFTLIRWIEYLPVYLFLAWEGYGYWIRRQRKTCVHAAASAPDDQARSPGDNLRP